MQKGFIASFFVVFLLFSVAAYAFDGEQSCVKCHSDKTMLKKLGAPQMYIDPAAADEEIAMGGAPSCTDCHQGNSESMDKKEAHKGMPTAFYAAVGPKYKYQSVGREVTGYFPIRPEGKARISYLMAKISDENKKLYGINKLMQLMYPDRDPITFAFDPDVAGKMCGTCHEDEFNGYKKSGMGMEKYQKAYTTWANHAPGPQNCGAWFGGNYDKIKAETDKPYTEKMNAGLDRGCNKCHASCLDCHYDGAAVSKAGHVFKKTPENLSCYGGGRGEICHAGPMDRRRGAGYLRGDFAFPKGELEVDVHASKGIKCVECHRPENHDFGTLGSAKVRASCDKCHAEIAAAVKTGDHSNVDCTSCHIGKSGAYQFTFWGNGISEGQQNYYTKHKEYYGIRDLPTLVKQPATGLWIPLKPYPMAVMGINKDVKASPLSLRVIPETFVKGNQGIGLEDFTVKRSPDQVNDMFVLTGTFKGYGDNDRMMAWIQMDKLSHGIGKSRDCRSCHSSHAQRSVSWFTFATPTDVKKPFSGSYVITADKSGMRFTDLTVTPIEPVEGRQLTDFAPFMKTLSPWEVKGTDFSIPYDEKKVLADETEYMKIYAEIKSLKGRFAGDKEKLERLGTISGVLAHNRHAAAEKLEKFKAGIK